jgi:phosphoglucomutase
MKTHPLAGKPVPEERLIDLGKLEREYFERKPDLADPHQLVTFGTSGHRGTSLNGTFTEAHILAVTQAICDYRRAHSQSGPLFMGMDTHALSAFAQRTALEVLAANGVDVFIQADGGFTPTPALSFAILNYNRGRKEGLADGIGLTPSHNPPADGGLKYNPPDGGPADTNVTGWIQKRANELLHPNSQGLRRMPYEAAMRAATTHSHDFRRPYVEALGSVLDMEAIRSAGVKMGVDPLGGASVTYWDPIRELYGLNITVVNRRVDPTFRFMTLDHDGAVRMDCSSPYAMAGLRKRRLYEVPVGFKYFTSGLKDGTLCFGGEESAGACFLRRDGTTWVTEKDGLLLGLLAAEIVARAGTLADQYTAVTERLGKPFYTRIDTPCTPREKAAFKKLSPEAVPGRELAGEPIQARLVNAPGNNAPIGGLKVVAANGWFAARPSGTENLYKLYAESFTSRAHLDAVVADAQRLLRQTLAGQ